MPGPKQVAAIAGGIAAARAARDRGSSGGGGFKFPSFRFDFLGRLRKDMFYQHKILIAFRREEKDIHLIFGKFREQTQNIRAGDFNGAAEIGREIIEIIRRNLNIDKRMVEGSQGRKEMSVVYSLDQIRRCKSLYRGSARMGRGIRRLEYKEFKLLHGLVREFEQFLTFYIEEVEKLEKGKYDKKWERRIFGHLRDIRKLLIALEIGDIELLKKEKVEERKLESVK